MTAARTLLEELCALGGVITTDGAMLTIDAPIGVITPALREQLSEQKQDLIELLRSPSSDQDTDGQLLGYRKLTSNCLQFRVTPQ